MSKKYKIPFNEFDTLYQSNRLFTSVKETCNLLDQLNNALYECIPQQYIGLCHFGAIDYQRDLPILFISQPHVFQQLNAMSEHILRHLNRKHFNFDKILFKTKVSQQDNNPAPKYKHLSEVDKQKLYKLANLIDKPELVMNELAKPNDNEIDL